MILISNPEEAFDLLIKLGTNRYQRLINHAQLVDEVSVILIRIVKELGIEIDEDFIRIGAILHDSGKILLPDEISGNGNRHEESGEQLLLCQGVAPRIARFCMTHSRWKCMICSLEELLVALADNLWKGKRQEQLELMVIKDIAGSISRDFWDIFIQLDEYFESIAADGVERLGRSLEIERSG